MLQAPLGLSWFRSGFYAAVSTWAALHGHSFSVTFLLAWGRPCPSSYALHYHPIQGWFTSADGFLGPSRHLAWPTHAWLVHTANSTISSSGRLPSYIPSQDTFHTAALGCVPSLSLHLTLCHGCTSLLFHCTPPACLLPYLLQAPPHCAASAPPPHTYHPTLLHGLFPHTHLPPAPPTCHLLPPHIGLPVQTCLGLGLLPYHTCLACTSNMAPPLKAGRTSQDLAASWTFLSSTCWATQLNAPAPLWAAWGWEAFNRTHQTSLELHWLKLSYLGLGHSRHFPPHGCHSTPAITMPLQRDSRTGLYSCHSIYLPFLHPMPATISALHCPCPGFHLLFQPPFTHLPATPPLCHPHHSHPPVWTPGSSWDLSAFLPSQLCGLQKGCPAFPPSLPPHTLHFCRT